MHSRNESTERVEISIDPRGLRKLGLRLTLSVLEFAPLGWTIIVLLVPAVMGIAAIGSGAVDIGSYVAVCVLIWLLIWVSSTTYREVETTIDPVRRTIIIKRRIDITALASGNASIDLEDVESATVYAVGEMMVFRLRYSLAFSSSPAIVLIPRERANEAFDALESAGVELRRSNSGVLWGWSKRVLARGGLTAASLGAGPAVVVVIWGLESTDALWFPAALWLLAVTAYLTGVFELRPTEGKGKWLEGLFVWLWFMLVLVVGLTLYAVLGAVGLR